MKNHIIILEVWYNDPVLGGGKFIKESQEDHKPCECVF